MLTKGVPIFGIDTSEGMLAKLRAKLGGAELMVLCGRFAAFKIEKHFRLIYVVINMFFNLLTQEEQVSCFRSVGEHLTPDGVFVLEAFVPDMARFVDGQAERVAKVTEDEVHLHISHHDPLAQQMMSQQLFFSNQGTRMDPVRICYAWPSELDLMAQLAGLSLRHRWSSWAKDAFTKESPKHISIYKLP